VLFYGELGEEELQLSAAQKMLCGIKTALPKVCLLHGVTSSGKTEIYQADRGILLQENKSCICCLKSHSLLN
jgi:primosomal protein N'